MPECFRVGFWPHAFDGLTLGSIYAMIALGYTMVYGVLQLINFAHGEIFMIGSFAGLYSLKLFEADDPLRGPGLVLAVGCAVLLSMLASGFAAVALERVAYRPLRRRGAARLSFLITAIGASLFLSNLFFVLTPIGGPAPRPYPNIMARSVAFEIFGYSVTNRQLLIFFTMPVMFLFLDRFVMKTKTGRGVRALAEDPQAASLMGVNAERMVLVTFLVGGLMAGAAGLLYGLFFGEARSTMGFIPGIKAFTAAVLGGIGNIRGAVAGGLLLGLAENLGVTCIGSQWQDVIAFLILVGVLMFRPTGILGEQVRG